LKKWDCTKTNTETNIDATKKFKLAPALTLGLFNFSKITKKALLLTVEITPNRGTIIDSL
jgi:hypothetical protein